jgi:hypothetical protein
MEKRKNGKTLPTELEKRPRKRKSLEDNALAGRRFRCAHLGAYDVPEPKGLVFVNLNDVMERTDDEELFFRHSNYPSSEGM